jgi:solute carrier family 41
LKLQAIVVGLLASLLACLFDLILKHSFDLGDMQILVGSSVATASFASLALGILIIGVILLSVKFKINPDNISTPIAASVGDLVTLAILAGYATFLYSIGIFKILLEIF